MRNSFAFAALALSLSGCVKLPPLPGPGPTPTPEPPPPPACPELTVPWCHETSPPMTCGACKHQPPEEACPVMAPKCEEPTPQPTPTPPSPPATAPLIPDEELSAQQPQDGQRLTWSLVSATVDQWRAENPGRWRADGACLIDGPAGIDAAFQGISDTLVAAGVVAGQSISADGQRSDCIFTNRTGTNVYEEAHLFDYARACVATSSSAIKGTWIRGASAPPPSVSACPEPRPAEAGQIGGIGRIGMKPHGGVRIDGNVVKILDATPNVYAGKAYEVLPSENYCAKIGSFAGDGVSGNTWCPARLEGNPDRSACEKWGLRAKGSSTPGDMRWLADQGRVLVNLDNSFQAGCDGCTWLKACNADLSFCSDPVPAP